MAELNDSFIDELLKAAITNKNTLDILIKHLYYEHLATEPYKVIWREITTFYELENKLPTIGILSQAINDGSNKQVKLDCRHILASIKKLKVSDVHDEILTSFEKFKKEKEFAGLYEEIYDMYAENPAKAINHMAVQSEKINNFSLKDSFYNKVFEGFEKRQTERQNKDPDLNDERITTGIHEQDYYTRGGFKKGTSFLVMGRSGTGKSTYLRWCAVSAARLGYRVVLFSLEGTEEETLEALDSCWTGTPLDEMEFGRISESKIKGIEKSMRSIVSSGGEIYVYCAENFDGMTIEQAHATIIEIEKVHGKVDMALFDYLELFEVGGIGSIRDQSGERRRREKIANKITDMAVELKIVTGAATQANDIPPDKYENEDFVLTRTNVSEFKGVVKPFSYFFTINQTTDEADAKVCRIYNDKFRKHRAGQVIRFFQNLNIGRFYDAGKTHKYFWDKDSKRPKSI